MVIIYQKGKLSMARDGVKIACDLYSQVLSFIAKMRGIGVRVIASIVRLF